jgi:ubiquinone/menaquinone biosynthesis C-methylase UbiE
MRLSKQVLERVDRRLVERINEMYHDLEGGIYDERHEDIKHFEQLFWEEKAKKHLVGQSPVVCLDYGTGTGFVPLAIGPLLKKADFLICCDLSTEMLKVCEDRIKASNVACTCSFRRIEGTRIPVESNSVDAVTVNAVLHHVYDLASFAKECQRILRSGGILIIAHEPNKDARLPFPGDAVRGLAKLIFNPRTVFFKIAGRIPLTEGIMRRILSKTSRSYRVRNKMLDEIARRLKEEGLLDFDLRGTEVQQVVDIHTQYGFDAQELLQNVFTGFELVELETFNHLGFSTRGKLAGRIDEYIKRKWPDAGKGMRFVLRMTN